MKRSREKSIKSRAIEKYLFSDLVQAEELSTKTGNYRL